MNVSVFVDFVIRTAAVGGIAWLLWWLVDFLKIPDPFNKFLRGAIAVVSVVFLIALLLVFVEGGESRSWFRFR
jgi:hypothetical protein